MPYIDSPKNSLIQWVSGLHNRSARQEKGWVLVEGLHPIEEAVKAGWAMQFCFLQEGEDPTQVTPLLSGSLEITEVSERAMAKISTTASPPPIAAVFEIKKTSLNDIFHTTENPLLVLLYNLQDPGNVGSMVRSAVAFGASGVIATQETADFYSPKTVRSSAGLLFRIPCMEVTSPSIEDLLHQVQEHEFQIVLTAGQPPKSMLHAKPLTHYRSLNYRKPTLLVLGSEGNGLPDSWLGEAPQKFNFEVVTIPMAPGIDSLNVATSGSIVLAEAAYQRSGTKITVDHMSS